ALIDWSARRSPVLRVLFNVGTLSLAGLAAAGVFEAARTLSVGRPIVIASAIAASGAYFAVNMGLLSLALGIEGRQRPLQVWRERFMWLLPHYAAFGFVAGVIAIAYAAVGVLALGVAVLPLLLMRKTQAAYLAHTERSSMQLREAAETIH